MHIDASNIDEHVCAQNPLSEKLIKFHCKVASIEDAMGVVKKAFDNDIIDLETYLKTIRQLAKKQCKSLIKTNRLLQGTSQPGMTQAMPPMPNGMGQMPGQPAMGQMGMGMPPQGMM